MGTYHIDPECEAAKIRLNDALCSFERNTSREYTLVLMPHNPGEKIMISESGKPISPPCNPIETLQAAMQIRNNNLTVR